MASHARFVHNRPGPSGAGYAQAARILLAICGTLLVLLGTILAAGGLLSPINGSPFQVLTGIALIVSGALVARGRRAGAGMLLVVFAATLTWSMRNIEAGGSPLAQRLVGPSLVLVMITLLLPVLCQWRPRQALTVFATMLTVTVAFAISASPDGPLARPTAAVIRFLDTSTNGVLP
jgi:quinoprotein glucose dehydrogenase